MEPSAGSRAEAIIRRAIVEWIPVVWGRDDADQLDASPLARAIAGTLDQIETANDTAGLIASVFADAFPDHGDQFTQYGCASVGARVYRDLTTAGLI
jgi:hypothetical protein